MYIRIHGKCEKRMVENECACIFHDNSNLKLNSTATHKLLGHFVVLYIQWISLIGTSKGHHKKFQLLRVPVIESNEFQQVLGTVCVLAAPVLSLRGYEGSWQRWSYDLLTLLLLQYIFVIIYSSKMFQLTQ